MAIVIVPAYTDRNRAYCKQMKEIIKEAISKRLSRSEIARIVAVTPSTVRNWEKTGNGSLNLARILVRHLDSLGAPKHNDQSSQNDERIAEFNRWIEDGKRFGFICPFAISSMA